MPRTLATMITATTYGRWLRGDLRGWVDQGRVLPPDPQLEWNDRQRMKHAPFSFDRNQLFDIGEQIGVQLGKRLDITVFALTVQTWHVHAVIGPTAHKIGVVVKCLKDAARYHLRIGRPIWATGYDKRFCFDRNSVLRRMAYVERHNLERGWDAVPWDFLGRPW